MDDECNGRWAPTPWQQVHIDFSGPFSGTMYLVMVDDHAKQPEIFCMKPITAAQGLGKL